MKKYLLCALLLSGILYSQSGWSWQNPFPQGNLHRSVQSMESSMSKIEGNNDLICKKQNNKTGLQSCNVQSVGEYFLSTSFPNLNKLNKTESSHQQKPGGSKTSMYLLQQDICDDTIKQTFTYDDRGNILVDLVQTYRRYWWVNWYRYTYSYDIDGNRRSRLYEIWINNAWVNSKRDTVIYDSNNHLISSCSEVWTNNTWEYEHRYSSVYDMSGFEISFLFEDWTNNTWVNNTKYSYTNDNNGKQSTKLCEIWANNSWIKCWIDSVFYDDKGNLLVEMENDWVNNAWEVKYRISFNYDSCNNQLNRLDEKWENSVWTNLFMWQNIYNNAGAILSNVSCNWVNNSWEYNARDSYEYDNNYNLLSVIHELWVTSKWENNSKCLYTYDENGNTIHAESYVGLGLLRPGSGTLTFFYNHKKSQMFFNNTTVTAQYTTISDIGKTQGISKTYSLSQNYPNPFNPSTTINYSLPFAGTVKLSVYNTLGQSVKELLNETQQQGTHQAKFNAGNLPSGVYFYSLKAASLDGKQIFREVKKCVLMK